VDTDLPASPEEFESLKAALAKAQAEAALAQAELAVARAQLSNDQALIAHLKLEIAKLNRYRYGPHAERAARLVDQMELQLEELEASATVDEIAAEMAAAKARVSVAPFTRQRPARKPFPDHLPRERVIVPAPAACPCCGGTRLSKLGEDVTATLEVIPRQWKVIQHVREKFACRDCEAIGQAPAPFHVIPRGWAGPSLLAMIAFEKFGQHQPLNRQAERYTREGVPLSLSTLADQVGAVCAVMQPIFARIEAHVFAGERLHADDTTVPVLAKGKTAIGRCWTYVRDDRPFAGPARPAAVFYYSRDRRGEHPQAHLATYAGILRADAYGGYDALYDAERSGGPILQAACSQCEGWSLHRGPRDSQIQLGQYDLRAALRGLLGDVRTHLHFRGSSDHHRWRGRPTDGRSLTRSSAAVRRWRTSSLSPGMASRTASTSSQVAPSFASASAARAAAIWVSSSRMRARRASTRFLCSRRQFL
jgi:transposase